MGQVFKAEHRRMKRVVAIKMLPKAVMKDEPASHAFSARSRRRPSSSIRTLSPPTTPTRPAASTFW